MLLFRFSSSKAFLNVKVVSGSSSTIRIRLANGDNFSSCCCSCLKKEENNVNLIIINTDGHITGNGLMCKVSVANQLKLDVILCLGENSSSLSDQFRSNLAPESISILHAMSPSLNHNILKSQSERRRQRLNQLQRYITDFGKAEGKITTLSLKKIKFVYRGLTYFKGLDGNDLILISKHNTYE